MKKFESVIFGALLNICILPFFVIPIILLLTGAEYLEKNIYYIIAITLLASPITGLIIIKIEEYEQRRLIST